MPRNSGSPVISNWHTLFEDFSTSTQDFYTAVEEAVARRNLPEIKISRVLFSERGIGSPDREYLRVRRYRVAFDICSAPYGDGHFFSWWLAKIPAKYGLFKMLALLLGIALVLGILIYPVRNSCLGGMLSVGAFFLGIPVMLLLLGIGIDQGYFGDEEWVLSVPVVGYLYALFFNPTTYYRLDTAMMFRDSIRAAVNEVINEVRQEKGLRVLSDEELRPDARDKEPAG
jgi:hypothetical protein